ncbi:hypothetical protein NKH74_16100 [Mesorhizobium sp. M0933]|uniref:hypothetical protein n=1 Tax=Mesorhizobium sp. M0933 TaxID=2957030 RepID=UPI00333D7A34
MEEALNFCVEHDQRSYISWGRFYRGLALFRRMEQRDGLDLMRSGIAGTDKINQRILQTARFGHFAEALSPAKRGNRRVGE